MKVLNFLDMSTQVDTEARPDRVLSQRSKWANLLKDACHVCYALFSWTQCRTLESKRYHHFFYEGPKYT